MATARGVMMGAALAALAGCATPKIEPIGFAPTPQTAAEPQGLGLDGDTIMLAFSGGGARASAFSLGVLQGLREMDGPDGEPLLDDVALVSGVSGGAVTAAYFGLNGEAGLDRFRSDYLLKDAERALNTNAFSPANWFRLLGGGVNSPGGLSSWFDTELFRGAHMSALWREDAPRVWINATDLRNGSNFAFTQPYFDAICADLSSVRVADAVAASMAVPLVFRPVPVTIHADQCTAPLPAWVETAAQSREAPLLLRSTARAFQRYRDSEQMKFVHLVDGGVTDNLALTTLLTQRRVAASPLGPFTAQDAVRVRRLTVLVVNAEPARNGKWALTPEGPSGVSAASAALESSMDASKRAAFDSFRAMLSDWERDVRAYRCALKPEDVIALRGSVQGWNCADVNFSLDMISFVDLPNGEGDKLGALATKVSLPIEDVDALIAGGKYAVQANASAQALTK